MPPTSAALRHSPSRRNAALAAAAAAALAVGAVAVARGAHLLRLGADPARAAARSFGAIAASLPATVQLVSCQRDAVERDRSRFLAAYFLAPRTVRLDPALEPAAGMRAALAQGEAIVIEATPGTACARDIEAALASGRPRTLVTVPMVPR